MSFKDNLAQARKAADMTQLDLAIKLGISDKAVSQWERGETVPELEKVPLIAKHLGTTAGWLLDDEPGLSRDEREWLGLMAAVAPRERDGLLRLIKAYLGDSRK